MLCQPLRDPFFRSLNRIGDDATFCGRPDDVLEAHPRLDNVRQVGIELTIARIAQHHSIIGVEQRKALRASFECVGQPPPDLHRLSVSVRQFLRTQPSERSSMARSLSKSAYAAPTAARNGCSDAELRPRCRGAFSTGAGAVGASAPHASVRAVMVIVWLCRRHSPP